MRAVINATEFEHYEDFMKVLCTLRAIQNGKYIESRETVEDIIEALSAVGALISDRIDPVAWLVRKGLIKRNSDGVLVQKHEKLHMRVLC